MVSVQEAPNSKVRGRSKARVPRSDPIYEIWGGMTGRIWVFHSAWNHNRVVSEIISQFDKEDSRVGLRLKEAGVAKEQVRTVANTLTKYGNLMVEGDMIAMDHILSLLRFLYPAQDVFIRNSWLLGLEPEAVMKSEAFKGVVQNSNLVLLCGPLGNLATRILLESAGLSWLFDPRRNYLMRTHPEKDEFLCPAVREDDSLLRDYGVFLRCRNPFNSAKRMYAAMGAHAYGTQGAAAVACSDKSAREVVRAPIGEEVRGLGVERIVWVKVWRPSDQDEKEESELKEFSDLKVRYRIEYPQPPLGLPKWESHSNPSRIRNAQTRLRRTLLSESTVFLGARPTTLAAHTFFTALFGALVCALVTSVVPAALVAGLLILAGLGMARTFVAILMPPKPAQRAMGKKREAPNV